MKNSKTNIAKNVISTRKSGFGNGFRFNCQIGKSKFWLDNMEFSSWSSEGLNLNDEPHETFFQTNDNTKQTFINEIYKYLNK